MGWMDDCMHVCNIDMGGVFVAKDQRSMMERRQDSAKESSSTLDALKYPNQKKVNRTSNGKARDKNGRPSGWRKVKIESVSQKRDGAGMDLDGEYPDDVPALNDDLHTSMANGAKPKQEVKPIVDKYQGVQDRKPIDILEIEPSDSASEITLPEALNGVLTSFFGFNFKYDDVTQPELEHLEINVTLNKDEETMETEDVQRLADTSNPSSYESLIKITENDTPIQHQNESNMLQVDEPFSEKRQEDELKANQSTVQEKTTGTNESMPSNNGFPNGKTSLDGRSETREPDTPIHDQQASFNTKNRDTDTRDDGNDDDDDDDDAEIEKSNESHHEAKTKTLSRIVDKYQPLHQIVKDLSAKERALQSKKGVDHSSLVASTQLSNSTTSNKTTMNTSGNEAKYVPPIRPPNNLKVGVGAISQAYRRGRVVATTSEQIPNPVWRLCDVDEPTHESVSPGIPSAAEISRQPAGRFKSESSTMTKDHDSSGDAFPFASSRATQIRPGSLRL